MGNDGNGLTAEVVQRKDGVSLVLKEKVRCTYTDEEGNTKTVTVNARYGTATYDPKRECYYVSLDKTNETFSMPKGHEWIMFVGLDQPIVAE